MRARDNGLPNRETTVEVLVFVTRDQFRPVFVRTPYVTSVQEDARNGTAIYTVTATDQDLQVIITEFL